jgi:hypothetical protein
VRLLIGLAVEHDRLRAVGVRGARVLWAMDAPVTDEARLAHALRTFLETLPRSRFTHPRVTVAIGPAFAQTKRLTGLPPITDDRLLARTVSEHAARFFLRNGAPLVTTSVRRDAKGQPWAAALQKPVVDTIVAACRTGRVRLVGIVPAADLAAPEPSVLAPLGVDARLFATAYGAAVAADALIWRAGQVAEESAPRWRIAALAGAAILALALAIVSPGLASSVAEHRAIAHLASVAQSTRAAQRVAHDNELVTRALGEVAMFDRGRRPVTVLMSEIAKVLPDNSALLALHVDSAGGSVVALTPRAGALLTRLERVSGLAAPEITGPVTRETALGHDVERVTVRFRWTRP